MYRRDSDGNYHMRSWPLTLRAHLTDACYATIFGLFLAAIVLAIVVPIILLTSN